MLKLPKGLKKKKKGKKSKKDQELFTEEELEQYRREHQNQSALNSAAPSDSEDQPSGGGGGGGVGGSGGGGGTSSGSGVAPTDKPDTDEEWSKFAALTSGIDSVLKKTQGDLDRIKSTSFFQKVPTRVEQEAKEREERERREQEERERAAEEARAREEQRAAEELINAVVELSESEPNSEAEAEQDIFDTGYIDAIASGELPIAYVPESPELESYEGEADPFDTSYAERVIKGPEVSKRGKKLVSIGSAVEVLTGRVESVAGGSTKGNRPRRGIQNLLLASFDESEQQQQGRSEGEPSVGGEGRQSEQHSVAAEPQCFSLLDDFTDLPADVPIDLSVSLHLTLQKQQQEEVASAPEGNGAAPELDLDEFDELKKRTPVLAGGDDFELLIGDAGSKAAASSDLPVVDLDEFEPAAVDDPFDTGFVERILPATAVEDDEFDPRAEEPPLPEDDFDFDPRAAERECKRPSTPDLFSVDQPHGSLPVRPDPPAKDLLSGSSTDLAGIAHAPLECTAGGSGAAPAATVDPFDTSDVEFIVAPGRTELKFLEQELLTDGRPAGLSHSLSDPDFDPRANSAEEQHTAEEEHRTEEDFQSLAQRKSSLSLHIANGAALTGAGGGANRSKSVVFAVPTPDLLKLDGEQSLAKKPLTPYYNREPSLPDADVDPFDTSFVPSVAPTQLELSLLERELNGASLNRSLSDPEFDPRASPPAAAAAATSGADLLGVSEGELHLQKVLTPARGSAAAVEADPFDTSIAVNLQPGRAELKLLEDELIPPVAAECAGAVPDILSDGAPEASSVFVKVLTPQASSGSLDLAGGAEQEEIDPFDTSFVPSLGPGRAEIKLLESELIDQH
uniref:Protein stoned-A n=1 Tax=Anopheles coluzzii TaxID=1518534 RepID=A0A6E8UY67_ANOCL|nr:protein stoned-A [Anopheles coluzzii]XP_040223525.2 protein stoned-A [Anopheles coluzzii]XP_040223532.2 protein stoned-A [Anopheles coluzzii]XP_040223541.2 protein stoned-A [Anopheles coluzzii]XP_040223550.2 protein stoned-A [Anopheles coluzzii]XP_040223560.2 protein stoned-A [Anopheles coluzzii]XP_040223568.2 protein stoned-A [Anopheles coluzzii]